MTLAQRGRGDPGFPPGEAVIDCDVHAEVPSVEALLPYLPEHWVEVVANTNFEGPVDRYYPPTLAHAEPGRAVPATLEEIRADVLDASGVAACILHCTYAVDGLHSPDHAAAIMRATNDWLIGEWLAADPRLRAAMVVPPQFPHLAAEEIERVGDHPGVVEVLLPARSTLPYGNHAYRPIWDAAARRGLVIGMHLGGAPGTPPTPSGWPTYYVEEYADMASVFATQITSLIVEGVFELHPDLRMTLIESGVTWLPTHMWHVDKEWKNLRRLVPWVKRPPSETMREHLRLTTQPLDAPPRAGDLAAVLDQLGSDEMLLYASDYPHRREAGDTPAAPWTSGGRPAAGLLRGNATSWYRGIGTARQGGER